MYCSIHAKNDDALRLVGGRFSAENANAVSVVFSSGGQSDHFTFFGLDPVTAEALSLLASASLGERDLILEAMRSIRAQVLAAASKAGI